MFSGLLFINSINSGAFVSACSTVDAEILYKMIMPIYAYER
jgi:hypothetical protein